MKPDNFPKLLYIGDVPVESTVGGSALIFRLLQSYPPEKLCIVEGNIAISQDEKRLPGVIYKTLNVGLKRLLHSRAVSAYTTYLVLSSKWQWKQLRETVNDFKPEAILTVAHGFSWLTAAEIARKYQLPLHFIVHDDWSSFTPVVMSLKPLALQLFKETYQQAKSRLCVSPYMVEYYRSLYQVDGQVLYPSRASDTPKFDQPPAHIFNKKLKTFAYAGSIHTQGQFNTFLLLATVLRDFDCQLVVYSPASRELKNNLDRTYHNLDFRDAIPYQKLAYELRENADVLFLPMDFQKNVKSNMQLCFPSKLADYTSIGLPLLILGPSYCSAVRWAKENTGVAEVVTTQNQRDLRAAVKKIITEPDYRVQLASIALQKGKIYFSYPSIRDNFWQFITQKPY